MFHLCTNLSNVYNAAGRCFLHVDMHREGVL